jgi:opine dehydrogenase
MTHSRQARLHLTFAPPCFNNTPQETRMHTETIGIVGSGNSARALAAHLSSQGYPVILCTRNPDAIGAIRDRKSIVATGILEGTFPVEEVTRDPARLAERCSTIFVASVTTAYRDIAARLAPLLCERHFLVLFSGKLCGSLEVAEVLRARGASGVPVIETDSLFDCRAQGDSGIWIRGFKSWTLLSCPQRSQTRRNAPRLLRFFPGLEEASNIIQRGLTDFGALAHAVISIANLNKIDRKESVLFYYEGLSEKTIVLLEQMEQEFQSVAEAYEARLISMKDLLNRYYGCDTESLLAAMRSVPNYRHSYAPPALDHRFLREDVAQSLVPMQALARKAGIDTPMIDAVISMTSVLSRDNMRSTGRTLERLGWSHLSHREIVDWMHQ